jgi:hypothetical protein
VALLPEVRVTGRQREALERKACSVLVKLMTLTDELRAAGITRNETVILYDAGHALEVLIRGPLKAGALSRQRYAR